MVDDDQDGVFVTIFTDGGENDSKELRKEAIRSLIDSKKEKSWVITFMGTTEEDIKNAVDLGISVGNTMYFANTHDGVTASFSKMNNMRNSYYTAATNVNSFAAKTIDTNNLVQTDDLLNGTTTISGKDLLNSNSTTTTTPIINDEGEE